MSACGGSLRLGLVETGDGLRHRCDIGVVGGLLGVVVLLGHDAGLEEALGAIPIQLFLLEVGLGMLDVGFGGLFGGNVGGNVGLGGGRWWPSGTATLASGCTFSMVAIIWPFFTWSPSFTMKVRNAAQGGCADVDVGLGLDLAGAADDRGKILAGDLGGQNLGVARLLLEDEEGNKSDGHNNGKNNQK